MYRAKINGQLYGQDDKNVFLPPHILNQFLSTTQLSEVHHEYHKAIKKPFVNGKFGFANAQSQRFKKPKEPFFANAPTKFCKFDN